MGFEAYCLLAGNQEAVAYDYCKLNALTLRVSPFLKIGDYDDIQEGQEVYTCGFPLSIERPFVSKGMISTKYIDRLNSITTNGGEKRMPRSQALLDLTMNPGNSGGPIVRLGKTIDEDEAIGLADFIVNPIGSKNANEIKNLLLKGVGKYNLEGVDLNTALIYFTEVISGLSIGVSGCVSTNPFGNALRKMKK